MQRRLTCRSKDEAVTQIPIENISLNSKSSTILTNQPPHPSEALSFTMSWISLTENDVMYIFADAEYSAITTKALNAGITDLVSSTIANATNRVRGYVAACDQNTLNTGSTIPENLKNATLDLIRFELLNRLNLDISEERLQSYRDSLRLLEQVATCKFAVDTPDNPETGTTQSGSSVTTVSSRDRLTTKPQTDGLF